ncbi:hypothetical protein KP509_18G036500 [Ceratopteris richardii]|uniref:SHSP domain-containing protein n=1 Tax=Ceratopteris richardii TaxID=49495 RepID=A0A8T2SPH4_CERRI|nr:hypothetical protein KP509_18G036500 [Ceratopteris richardii]
MHALNQAFRVSLIVYHSGVRPSNTHTGSLPESSSKALGKMNRFFWLPTPEAYAPPVDWLENSSAHIFRVDLPGVSKKDVQVHVHDDNTMEINGEVKFSDEKEPATWHASERYQGRFHRRFHLPDNVRVDDVKAGIEGGVLTITIPKKPQPKVGVRSVPVVSKL